MDSRYPKLSSYKGEMEVKFKPNDISVEGIGSAVLSRIRHIERVRLIKLAVVSWALLLCLQIAVAPRAMAIPAFARKYETSCSTCHNNFPELNDFGEAFKKNGFKFPKDDEILAKQPPVLLGAPAQRQMFPRRAVYPGEIPGSLPIGFRFSGFASYNNKQPVALGFVPRSDLFAPDTFTLLAAGSLGQTLSFWIDDDLSVGGSGAGGGLGDGYLKANDLGRFLKLPKDTLNVRFGQFELDLPFSDARSINPTGYDVYDQASVAGPLGTTNNSFVFAEPQRGIEFGGYPHDGNFSWSVALMNGSNADAAFRNTKDVYIRVSQKFNLERDAKVRREVQAAGASGPRDHTSIRLGGFYYYGKNELNLDGQLYPGIGVIREPFYRAGGDFRFKYHSLELYGLGMHGHDQNLIPNPVLGLLEIGQPVTFTGGFVEAEAWFLPWLIGIMRYDGVNSYTDFLNGLSRNRTRSRYSPGVQMLVRNNIKAVFEYQRGWERSAGQNGVYYRPQGFVTGVDYVF